MQKSQTMCLTLTIMWVSTVSESKKPELTKNDDSHKRGTHRQLNFDHNRDNNNNKQ